MGKKIPPDWSELGDEQIGRRRWRLGEIEFDEVSRELRLRGERVAIEPKPLDCLIALLRRPNDVVKKHDLCRWVWSGRPVSESVLTKSIAKLRTAIEDEDQHIIKTVHGYGYRLMVAAVELEPENSQLQLKPRQFLPKHPEIRLLRRMDEASNLWSAELTANQAPRVICASLMASSLPGLRKELQFTRRLAEHPATSLLALPLREWNLDQPPYFICREPLAGLLLPEWLAANQRLASAGVDERMEWLAALADAVASVHEAGLHFDGGLKPDCFVVSEVGGTTVHKLALAHTPTWLLPSRQQPVLAERYRAPELLEGLQPGPAADVYALGVLGYHLLTNRWSAALAPGWETLVPDPLLVSLLGRATHQNMAQRLGAAQLFAQSLRQLPQARIDEQQARLTRVERRASSAVRAPSPLPSSAPPVNPLANASTAGTAEAVQPVVPLVQKPGALYGAALAVISFFALLVRKLRKAWRRIAGDPEQHRAEAVSRFWGDRLLAHADPYAGGASVTALVAVLDSASVRLAGSFGEMPDLHFSVAETISRSYARLGLNDKALALSAQNLRLAQALPGSKARQLSAEATACYTALLVANGHAVQARPLLDAQLQQLGQLPPSLRRNHRHTCLLTLARAEAAVGNYAQAVGTLKLALKNLGSSQAVARQDQRAAAQAALAHAQMGLGEWREAEFSLRAALGWYDRGRAEDVEGHVIAGEISFCFHLQQEQWADVEADYERMQNFAHILPDRQRMQVLSHFHHARHLLARQRPAEALPLALEVYGKHREVLGAQHSRVLASAALLVRVYLALDEREQALALAEENRNQALTALGARHPLSLKLSTLLAEATLANGQKPEAIALARRTAALAVQSLPPGNRIQLDLHTLLGDLLAGSEPASAHQQWQSAFSRAQGQFTHQHSLLNALRTRMAGARTLPSAGSSEAGLLLSQP